MLQAEVEDGSCGGSDEERDWCFLFTHSFYTSEHRFKIQRDCSYIS